MRVREFGMLGMVFLLLFLSACSGGVGAQWDPAEVEAELTTDPQVVRAGEEITLIASFTGIPDKPGSDMRFDIPHNGKSYLVKSEDVGDGTYTLLFTFPKAGTYDVYLHYYVDGEHITKIKKLEVL
jgi:hypothetical protein